MNNKKLANLFKVFGDETRINILTSLIDGKHTVSEITERCDLTISNASHQLKHLKKKHLVKSHKVGKNVYYELDDEHVLKILTIGLEHVLEQ